MSKSWQLDSGKPLKTRDLYKLKPEPAIWSFDTGWSADTLFWQLSIDHIMDISIIKLNTGCRLPYKLKYVISHWLPCGADGRTYVHVTTKI